MKFVAHDIRYALRGFLRTPAFTFTALLTLIVGIAGLTTVFTLLNTVLLRPLPVERPGELVSLQVERERGGSAQTFSYPQYELMRDGQRGLAGLAAYSLEEYAVGIDGDEPQFHRGYVTTAEYFDVLGLRPALGRFFTPGADDVRGGSPVAVVSHHLWESRFGGRADVIGSSIRINGQWLTVIGVAPKTYHGTIQGLRADFWVPISMVPALRPGSDIYTPGREVWLTLIGRLAPGTSTAQAEAMLTGHVRGLAQAGDVEFETSRAGRPPVSGVGLRPLRPVPQMLVGPLTGFFALLLAAALLVLLIASVNITSMMLARSTARAKEMALRRSLGASRLRLVGQLMTENVLLFAGGAAGGLLLASWLTTLIPLLVARSPIPIQLDLVLDLRVVAVGLGAALLAGVLFGLAPALHATSPHTMPVLREGATAPRGMRLRSAFVVAQLALSLVLLISAGLLGRTLQRALAVDPGFDATNVAVAQIDLRPFGYDARSGHLFFEQLAERLEARSEIQSAAISMNQPLFAFSWRWLRPEGHDEAPKEGIHYNEVDHGFFTTLRVPLLAGRTFTAADRAGAPLVAVVNEEFGRRFWPGEDAIGKRLHEGTADDPKTYDVVGVVADGKYRSLDEEPTPFVYLSRAQQRGAVGYIYARSDAGPAAALQALRAEVRALDGHAPLQTPASMEHTVGLLLTPKRLAASAIGTFGVIGLMLSLIGIYGLVAFSVAQRTREIGVRMALGAHAHHVITMFLRQGARLLVMGSIIGLVLALLAARLLVALLPGTSAADPLPFIGLPLLLAGAALIAAYLPARRASRLNPSAVLGSE